jgi:hypothetical protein
MPAALQTQDWFRFAVVLISELAVAKAKVMAVVVTMVTEVVVVVSIVHAGDSVARSAVALLADRP